MSKKGGRGKGKCMRKPRKPAKKKTKTDSGGKKKKTADGKKKKTGGTRKTKKIVKPKGNADVVIKSKTNGAGFL